MYICWCCHEEWECSDARRYTEARADALADLARMGALYGVTP